MNSQIINNLYEFWSQIGVITKKLIKTENYSAVSMIDSDWPNRIFDSNTNDELIERVLKLSPKGELPEVITVTKPNELNANPHFEFLFSQKNMALDLISISLGLRENTNIQRVKTQKDCIEFAKAASQSFGYRVDEKVVSQIVNGSEKFRLFNYLKENDCLGCGLVFFDSKNNAGLHMIGTVPKGRGQGIGRILTEKLLFEAKEANKKYGVLHASAMGEPIYRKLGFQSYGELETYKILKQQD